MSKEMGVLARIFMLICLTVHTTAASLLATVEAEVWDAWKAHVDKFHHGDSDFLQQADRYEAFRETLDFVKSQNARHAAGKSGFTVELNYRAAYLPHERTRGFFQPANVDNDGESHLSTSRKLLTTFPCGPYKQHCYPGYCCGPCGRCSKSLDQCTSPLCKPEYGDCINPNKSTGLVPRPLQGQLYIPSTVQTVEFQYDSVPVSSLADGVDWRPYVNAVQDQGLCGNCWAYSTSAAIESATAIATNQSRLQLSTQQLTDCSSGSAGGSGKGCIGGFPDLAMGWVAQRRTLGVATDASYPNVKQDQKCRGDGAFGAGIAGYGYVPKNSELAVKQALKFQPIIVNIKADFSLQTYRGGILDDKECGNEVNHAVLAVGYGTDKAANKSYLLLMNSWGPNWGEGGFFRVALTGDGYSSGICGVYFNPPTFPIIKPLSNPCRMQPCGGGVCVNSNSSKGGYYCSKCPDGFVVRLNPDQSQTCGDNPCLKENPCGSGTCLLSTASRFGYRCTCSKGSGLGSFNDGAPTCTSGSITYTVRKSDLTVPKCSVAPDFCANIAARNNITKAMLLEMNTGLNCKSLKAGQILTVARNVPDPGCKKRKVAKAGDTCESIRQAAGLDNTTFFNLNANLDCDKVPVNWQVCVSGTPSGLTSVSCGRWVSAQAGTACQALVQAYNLGTVRVLRYLNNYMIYCPNLQTNRQVCIRSASGGLRSVRCQKYWAVQAGNTCWQIWTTFNLTESQFTLLNPGLLCDFLEIGRNVCVG